MATEIADSDRIAGSLDVHFEAITYEKGHRNFFARGMIDKINRRTQGIP